MVRALRGELVQHAVGDEDPALAGERSSRAWNGSFLSVWISTSSALFVTAAPEPGDRQPVAHLQPVVDVGVDVERDEPLRDQVAPVDAGEPWARTPQTPSCRERGGMLTAGALAVVRRTARRGRPPRRGKAPLNQVRLEILPVMVPCMLASCASTGGGDASGPQRVRRQPVGRRRFRPRRRGRSSSSPAGGSGWVVVCQPRP
jgi:hypothetical protein